MPKPDTNVQVVNDHLDVRVINAADAPVPVSGAVSLTNASIPITAASAIPVTVTGTVTTAPPTLSESQVFRGTFDLQRPPSPGDRHPSPIVTAFSVPQGKLLVIETVSILINRLSIAATNPNFLPRPSFMLNTAAGSHEVVIPTTTHSIPGTFDPNQSAPPIERDGGTLSGRFYLKAGEGAQIIQYEGGGHIAFHGTLYNAS